MTFDAHSEARKVTIKIFLSSRRHDSQWMNFYYLLFYTQIRWMDAKHCSKTDWSRMKAKSINVKVVWASSFLFFAHLEFSKLVEIARSWNIIKIQSSGWRKALITCRCIQCRLIQIKFLSRQYNIINFNSIAQHDGQHQRLSIKTRWKEN